MDQGAYNALLEFLQNATAQHQEQQNAALEVFNQFINVETIPYIFEALKQSSSTPIRSFCIILLRKIRISCQESFDDGIYEMIVQNLIENILKEQQYTIRANMVEELAEYHYINTELITNFAQNLFENQNLISTGLYFILKFIDFDDEYGDFINQMLPLLQNQFESNDEQTRTLSFKIFENAIFRGIKYIDVLNECEWIPELIFNHLQRVCTSNASFDEAKAVIDLIEQALASEFYSGFDENQLEIYTVLATGLANQQLSVDIRLYIIQVIDDLFEFQVEESFSESFQIFIDLAANVYQELPGSEDYRIPLDLLVNSKFYEIYNRSFMSIIEILQPFIESEDEGKIVVSLNMFTDLFALLGKGYLPNAASNINDLIEPMTKYCLYYLSIDNANIVSAAAQFSQELFSALPNEMQNSLTELCTSLAQNINFMPNINALANILMASSVPPENHLEILDELLSSLSNTDSPIFADSLLQAIGCLIEIMPHGYDEQLSQLIPALNTFIGTGDKNLVAPAFECFSSLVVACPNLIVNHVEELVTTIVQLNKDLHNAIFDSAFSLLITLAGYLPDSILPLLKHVDQFIYDTIVRLDSMKPHKEKQIEEEEEEFNEEESQNDEEEEKDEESVFDMNAKTESFAIRALGELMVSFPSQLQNRMPFLLTMIKELNSSCMPQVVEAAVQAAIPLTMAMIKIGKSADDVLTAVLMSTPVANTVSISAAIWTVVGSVLEQLDQNGIVSSIGLISAFAAEAVGCVEDKRHPFHPVLQPPVLRAIQIYCERGGVEASEDILSIIQYIIDTIQSSNEEEEEINFSLMALSSPAIAACAVALQNEEMLEIAINYALTVLQQNESQKLISSAIECLIIITKHHPQMIAENATSVAAQIAPYLSSTTECGISAVSLIFAFNLFANKILTDKEAENCLSMFGCKGDSKYLPLAAMFVFKCATTNPTVFSNWSLQISCALLSANDAIRRDASEDIIQNCIQIVGQDMQQNGDSHVREILGFNQRLFNNLATYFQ